MLLMHRLGAWLKAPATPNTRPVTGSGTPGFFAPPYPTGGWWKNDATEQLRN